MKKFFGILLTIYTLLIGSSIFAESVLKTYPAFSTALAYDGEYFWVGQEYKVIKWSKDKGVIAEYNTKDGLPGTWIKEIYIAPDKKTVWAASDSGIARFDGFSWRNYTIQDGLADNSIGPVAFATDCTLWVGTNKGASRFDGNMWKTFTTKDGLVSNNIQSLAIDLNGIIWLGMDKGTSSYDGKKWDIYNTVNGLNESKIRKIVIDKNNVKWFGSENRGVFRFDGIMWSHFSMDNALESNNVLEMIITPNNTLWVSMGDIRYVSESKDSRYFSYLYKYDNNKFLIQHSMTNFYFFGTIDPFFNNLTIDNNGNLWFFFYKGLFSINTGLLTQIAETYNIRGTHKNVIFDNENNLWLLSGDYVDGYSWLIRLEKEIYRYTFNFKRQGLGPGTDNILTVSINPDNHKLIGSWRGLADYFNSKWIISAFDDEPVQLLDYAPSAFAFEDDQWIWVGGNGLIRFNWVNIADNSQHLPTHSARTMVFDKNRILWIGFGQDGYGAIGYDGTSWHRYTTANGLTNDNVYAISVDKSNAKWFGTSNGLSRYDGTTWTSFFTATEGDSIKNVTTLAFDTQNILWAGTYNGLLRYNGSNWARFTPKEGLADTLVLSLATGSNGVVWAGTPNGISRYDGKTWKTFTTADGLPSNRVQAVAVDHDNVVWIGTDKGLVSYQEDTQTFARDEQDMPEAFPAASVYPNPFNPSTTIEVTLANGQDAELSIFSITGQKVKTLISGQIIAGSHTCRWDGKDDSGIDVSSGIYIARLKTGNRATVKKMALVR